MMAIAQGLEERGATVTLAGGGFGRRFYDPNDYDVTEFPGVDYVRDFQDAGNPVGGVLRVLTNSLPASVGRVRGLADWLRREDPHAVVTDDMFAAMAATRVGTPLYVLTHNSPGLYSDPLVRLATRGLTVGQRLAAERFFYPTVWPPRGSDPPGISRVPPVALRNGHDAKPEGPVDPGVVLVPSTYSEGFDALAEDLEDAGHEVTYVGREDWDPIPALLPVLRRAEAVVCAGYSTVMEAAVAGTPCIVQPSTNEQVGVSRRLADLEGFAVVEGRSEVRAAVESPPSPPDHVNGDAVVAERVLDDLGQQAGPA
jgi:hypothetical protein